MAFVYNNKLPFYAWGHVGNPNNLLRSLPGLNVVNSSYQLAIRYVHLVVPLAESGARPAWENKSAQNLPNSLSISTKAPFEGVPCDAQMPWKMFANGSPDRVWGLTIHGEAYLIPSGFSYWWMADVPADAGAYNYAETWRYTYPYNDVNLCRLCRWSSPIVGKALKKLFNCDSLYPDSILAIDKDNAVWWLHDHRRDTQDKRTNAIGANATPVSIPPGKQAAFVYFGSFAEPNLAGTNAYVVTTTDNKTYIRSNNSNQWFALTTGCVEVFNFPSLEYPNYYGWVASDLPSATVSSPNDTNGTAATVTITFGNNYVENGITYKLLAGLRISNPGEGYTSNASVAFSRPPDVKSSYSPALNIQLIPWNRYVVGVADTSQRFSANLYSDTLTVPVRSLEFQGASGYKRLNSPCFIDNAGATVGCLHQPRANVSWLYSTFAVFTEQVLAPSAASAVPVKQLVYGSPDTTAQQINAVAIASDGKLYKLLSNAFGSWKLVNSENWISLAASARTYCAVKEDQTMWTFGRNSELENGEFKPKTFNGVYFGDGSEVNAQRDTPTQIATTANWVSVWPLGSGGFVAIRKDATCRSIDQPMEYWPDWAFG